MASGADGQLFSGAGDGGVQLVADLGLTKTDGVTVLWGARANGIPVVAAVETGLTAHSGGGQPGLLLSTVLSVHNVTVVAAGNDSVTLPVATGSGNVHYVANSAATNSLQVFGTTTDTINGIASGTGFAVAAGTGYTFIDIATAKWITA